MLHEFFGTVGRIVPPPGSIKSIELELRNALTVGNPPSARETCPPPFHMRQGRHPPALFHSSFTIPSAPPIIDIPRTPLLPPGSFPVAAPAAWSAHTTIKVEARSAHIRRPEAPDALQLLARPPATSGTTRVAAASAASRVDELPAAEDLESTAEPLCEKCMLKFHAAREFFTERVEHPPATQSGADAVLSMDLAQLSQQQQAACATRCTRFGHLTSFSPSTGGGDDEELSAMAADTFRAGTCLARAYALGQLQLCPVLDIAPDDALLSMADAWHPDKANEFYEHLPRVSQCLQEAAGDWKAALELYLNVSLCLS
ncbi:hypothetical protein T484DRAFT_1814789 [Baffinella frigidus]|nr:hypothetical protein T484DRAFT_1814789 [Cryptophyta sp. CCMP2293]